MPIKSTTQMHKDAVDAAKAVNGGMFFQDHEAAQIFARFAGVGQVFWPALMFALGLALGRAL